VLRYLLITLPKLTLFAFLIGEIQAATLSVAYSLTGRVVVFSAGSTRAAGPPPGEGTRWRDIENYSSSMINSTFAR
jgi:hypothetical protein